MNRVSPAASGDKKRKAMNDSWDETPRSLPKWGRESARLTYDVGSLDVLNAFLTWDIFNL